MHVKPIEKKKKGNSQAFWHLSVVPALWRLRQKDYLNPGVDAVINKQTKTKLTNL
jgi:hypothetical protein